MRIETSEWKRLPHDRRPEHTLFAIGDVHGHADALGALLDHLRVYIDEAYGASPVDLVFLGDLIDRGPDPLGVLTQVDKGIGLPSVSQINLLGNHDRFLAVAAGLRPGELTEDDWWTWINFGGDETHYALGVAPRSGAETYRAAMSDAQAAVLRDMALGFETGAVFCVHAGVDPLRAADDQSAHDMLWIREPFLTTAANQRGAWPFGATVVHGHTPSAFGVFAHRIGVDSGGYSTGVFTALEMTQDKLRYHHVSRRL